MRQYGKRGLFVSMTRNVDQEVVCFGVVANPAELDGFLEAACDVHKVKIGVRPHQVEVDTTNIDDLAKELGMEEELDAGEVMKAYFDKAEAMALAALEAAGKNAA